MSLWNELHKQSSAADGVGGGPGPPQVLLPLPRPFSRPVGVTTDELHSFSVRLPIRVNEDFNSA